jgi:hypothetical protein
MLGRVGSSSRFRSAAYDGGVSQAHQEPEPIADRSVTVEDLARAQHAEPVADPGHLAADIWESDAGLEAFLADLWASRNASLAWLKCAPSSTPMSRRSFRSIRRRRGFLAILVPESG